VLVSRPDSGGAPDRSAREESRRQRRLAEVFGDSMPDTTGDEREPDGSREGHDQEKWLREQIPPHHGS
jgi:hypothetical protein